MERFLKGDIVFVPFPFSDLSGTKKRPALIIAAVDLDDYILCQITSKEGEYRIPLDQSDFSEGKLPVKSFVRSTRIFTAHKSVISYKEAALKKEKVTSVLEELIRILKR